MRKSDTDILQFISGVGKLFTRKAALENNFEAEGCADWKSKAKKVITTADEICPIFHAISPRNKAYISVSAYEPHKMITRAPCGPQAVVCLLHVYTHATIILKITSNKRFFTTKLSDMNTFDRYSIISKSHYAYLLEPLA